MVVIPSVLAGKAQNVTLVVDDVPVVQVLQALAEQEGKNLVISPDVGGVLSLHLTDVPWKQAFQTVVKSAGLVLRLEGSILHVHSVNWQTENAARQRVSKRGFRPFFRWNIVASFCSMLTQLNWQKQVRNC